MLKSIWTKIKDWSGWSKAGSVFLYRTEAFLSLVVAGILGMDWTALMAMDFSNGFNYAVLIPTGLLFVKSILSEIVRKKNTKDF